MNTVVREGITAPAYNDGVLGVKIDSGALEDNITLLVSSISFPAQCIIFGITANEVLLLKLM